MAAVEGVTVAMDIYKVLEAPDEDALRMLRGGGYDVNQAVYNSKGELIATPLDYAITHEKDFAVIIELLKQGADPNVVVQGYSLLTSALLYDMDNIVKDLLHHGADPNIKGKRDETPLFDATYDPELVQMLLDAGAKANATSDSGRTPLYNAVRYKHPDSAKLLLNEDVDVHAIDHRTSGKDAGTPLQLVQRLKYYQKHPDIVERMKEKGRQADTWSGIRGHWVRAGVATARELGPVPPGVSRATKRRRVGPDSFWTSAAAAESSGYSDSDNEYARRARASPKPPAGPPGLIRPDLDGGRRQRRAVHFIAGFTTPTDAQNAEDSNHTGGGDYAPGAGASCICSCGTSTLVNSEV